MQHYNLFYLITSLHTQKLLHFFWFYLGPIYSPNLINAFGDIFLITGANDAKEKVIGNNWFILFSSKSNFPFFFCGCFECIFFFFFLANQFFTGLFAPVLTFFKSRNHSNDFTVSLLLDFIFPTLFHYKSLLFYHYPNLQEFIITCGRIFAHLP